MMKILVLVRQVLDPRGVAVNRRAGRVFVNREEYLVSPADRNALEAALQIKDAGAAVEVVAVAAGPERVEDALREALAMGADQAVRLPEAGPGTDGFVAGGLVAAAVRRLGAVDLVLAGERALDQASSELGARLAEALGYTYVPGARAVRVTDDAVQVVAAGPEGFVTLRAPLPAVITVAPGANKPRYPYAPRLIREHREGHIETWDDLAAGLEPRLIRGEPEAPPEQEMGRVVDDIAEVASALRPFVRGKVR